MSAWPECEQRHIVITICIFDQNSYIGEYSWKYPISDKAEGDDFLEIL